MDSIVQSVQEKYGGFFGKVTTVGAKVPTPPLTQAEVPDIDKAVRAGMGLK